MLTQTTKTVSNQDEAEEAQEHRVEFFEPREDSAIALQASEWASPSFPDTSNDMMCSGDRHDKNPKELHGRIQT